MFATKVIMDVTAGQLLYAGFLVGTGYVVATYVIAFVMSILGLLFNPPKVKGLD